MPHQMLQEKTYSNGKYTTFSCERWHNMIAFLIGIENFRCVNQCSEHLHYIYMQIQYFRKRYKN